MTNDLAALEAGVHSIFEFIGRTARREGTRCTWETIDYENKPQFSPGVFNGVGGISFFLTDYYRRYGDPRALELGAGAIEWSAAFAGKHYERGLHFGKTGVALAALHRSVALEESAPPAFCHENAAIILREPAGPITDLVGGEASNGLYLLRLWARTRDDRYLAGAERCGAWLETQTIRDDQGTYLFIDPLSRLGFPPKIYLGAAHGLAGIAHFLVLLAEATGKDRWAALARELFATIRRYGRPTHGGVNWPVFVGQEELVRCQWSHGSPGIGLTLLTAHRVLGDREYLDLALQGAEATYGYGDFRHNYTLCTGLAGSGELLLATYRATDDARWRERTVEFAIGCLGYRETTPEGDAWPTDAVGLYSADYVYGAAGVGHFLLRVGNDDPFTMPLM